MLMYSAIRNAAAPMIGGIICPPVDAAASTAPANSGLFLLEAGVVLLNEQEAYVISLMK